MTEEEALAARRRTRWMVIPSDFEVDQLMALMQQHAERTERR